MTNKYYNYSFISLAQKLIYAYKNKRKLPTISTTAKSELQKLNSSSGSREYFTGYQIDLEVNNSYSDNLNLDDDSQEKVAGHIQNINITGKHSPVSGAQTPINP